LSQIMQSLPRQELAYLAALFHDIAKGRGGDHSELGAVDAEAFCLEQGSGRYEARLVAWLVRNHLILSITSQKKDISDPDIIHDFRAPRRRSGASGLSVRADRRRRARHQSEAVECLEGAAVRGILRAHQARAAPRARDTGRSGGIDPRDPGQRARENAGVPPEQISQVWSQWTEAYFLRYTPEEIAWQTTCSPPRPDDDAPLVAIRQLADRGGTAVLTYTRGGCTASRAPPRCSIRWASTSSTRASSRAPTASAWRPTWCSRTTAR
jgi:[protein-PII] uridylyltransferase